MDTKIISIGCQTWTSENVSFNKFSNGDEIKESKNQQELDFANKNKIPTWHYIDFDKEKSMHGLCYNLYAINDSRNLWPLGWRIPTRKDWDDLLAYCGYLKEHEMTYLNDNQFDFFNLRCIQGMKSKKGWTVGRHKGNNESGFNALPDNNGKIAKWAVKENNNFKLLYFGSKLRLPISIAFNEFDSSQTSCIRLIKTNVNREIDIENELVKIGNLEWSTSNLNTEKFNNGDVIPIVFGEDEWIKYGQEGKPACAYYENNKENAKYGLLYNYYALIDKRGLVPSGFRIANVNDWLDLKNSIGAEPKDFLSLMNSELWNRVFSSGVRQKGNNSTKFNSIPSGIRRLRYLTSWEGEALYKSYFTDKGNYAYWWTSDGYSVYLGYKDGIEGESIYPEFNLENTLQINKDYLQSGLSVRYVKL